MDDGKGNLIQLDREIGQDQKAIGKTVRKAMRELEAKHPDHGGWFRIDEIVMIKGSRFRVKKIKPGEITLKLLPKKNN